MILAVDANTGDIALRNGTLYYATGAEEAAQGVRSRLRFFLGEWFLDTREGLPYWEEVLVAGPDLRAIEEAMRQVVLGSPRIVAIGEMALDFDRRTRELTVRLTATMDDGTVLTPDDFGPIIVGGTGAGGD
jgi:hypothetical protein